MQSGCGRKGDPVVPPVPQPLPIKNVSARVENNSIILSWTPPPAYDNDQPLELDDIKSFTIYRKTEAPASNSWDFSETSEGWTSAGRTLPIKLYKGILRTASEQESLLVVSQDDLRITAKDHPYIRLKLWAKNSQQGYITFITNKESTWDRNIDLTFQPTVHTSFYTYHNAFGARKLKAFPILTEEPFASEYLIDMSAVPAWKGKIKQVGLILLNSDPKNAVVELGLDTLGFVDTMEEKASFYETPPWLFLEDKEGWRLSQPGGLFEAVSGVLYAQGAEAITLLSKPGQKIEITRNHQFRIRMKVTAGQEACFVLHTDQQQEMIPIPLQEHTDFFTYTVDIPDTLFSKAAKKKRKVAQVGLVFPALEGEAVRHILIDYIDILPPGAGTTARVSDLAQIDMPPLTILEQQAQEKIFSNNPGFDMQYADLPDTREQVSPKRIKLAGISPKNPAPAELKEGSFFFIDTGNISLDDGKEATLNYGARYTYEIEFTDRKKRKSKLSNPVTVEFSEIPKDPTDLKAVAGDRKVTLTWDRPIFTTRGRKIQVLAGYAIFRSLNPGQYSGGPIARIPAQQTSFTDKKLENGIRYYYTIQSVISGGATGYTGKSSEEVSAIPVDNIPPDVPTGVVGIYLGNVVNIYWNQSQSSDFAGFNVYRSQSPQGEFRRINAEPVLQASYKDAAVETGKKYYYQVTSFDTASPPNESTPSEITLVETFPLD